jgi:hypothetical protein
MLERFRWWTSTIPEHIGELLAIAIYLTFMMFSAGAVISFSLGAYTPCAIFIGGTAFIIALVYLL